jgi:CheY-like chemotaxis protein
LPMVRILIADDSNIIRKLLRTLLSEHPGWTVYEAVNGLEAIAMASDMKPDLVILDVAMPGLDGLRACAEILKSAPLIPVVLYTLYKSEHVDLEAKRVGARTVISKIDDSGVLLQCLEELLGSNQIIVDVTPSVREPALTEREPSSARELPRELEVMPPQVGVDLDSPPESLKSTGIQDLPKP